MPPQWRARGRGRQRARRPVGVGVRRVRIPERGQVEELIEGDVLAASLDVGNRGSAETDGAAEVSLAQRCIPTSSPEDGCRTRRTARALEGAYRCVLRLSSWQTPFSWPGHSRDGLGGRDPRPVGLPSCQPYRYARMLYSDWWRLASSLRRMGPSAGI